MLFCQCFYGHAALADIDRDQTAGLIVHGFVHRKGFCRAICAEHGNIGLNCGISVLGDHFFRGFHHPIVHRFHAGPSEHIHHGTVHPQQQRHDGAGFASAQRRQLISGGRAANFIGSAGYRDGSRRRGAGRQLRDLAGDPVGVDPQRAAALIIIVDIVLIQYGGRGNFSVSVDCCRLEGQRGGTVLSYIGAAEVFQRQGGIVHLSVGHCITQSLGIDLTAAGFSCHQIGEKCSAVPPGHSAALLQADPVPQAQCCGLTQLSAWERAGQSRGVVAQQLQHRGARLLQLYCFIRPEGPVGIAGHPAL